MFFIVLCIFYCIKLSLAFCSFFFFQAEDGIRDLIVTGVQTCALPILIRDLQRDRGTAVLFITHDMGAVAEIADRVAVMRHGRLVETGTLHSILRNPTMEYTRNLLSAVPSLVPRTPRPASREPVVLEANELGKVYRERSFFGRIREVAAAKDVTLTLRKGRTLGIVGESGSGKSTVARCIVRLIDPTSGGIRLAGREISELSRRLLQPHRKRIQIIFQDPYRSLSTPVLRRPAPAHRHCPRAGA